VKIIYVKHQKLGHRSRFWFIWVPATIKIGWSIWCGEERTASEAYDSEWFV